MNALELTASDFANLHGKMLEFQIGPMHNNEITETFEGYILTIHLAANPPNLPTTVFIVPSTLSTTPGEITNILSARRFNIMEIRTINEKSK